MPTVPLLVSSLGTGDVKTKEGIVAVARKENHILAVKENLVEKIIQTRSLNFEFAALISLGKGCEANAQSNWNSWWLYLHL